MKKPQPARHVAPRALCALLAAVALGGCAQLEDWLRGDPRSNAPDDAIIPGTPGAERYIDEVYRLASGDPATQAEIFADAEASARLTPGTASELRLALVLAQPGHAQSDAERAQDLLRDLLSEAELMTPIEFALATIQLREVERRLSLAQETERLRREAAQSAGSERRAIEQRIAAVEAENRQLRQSLADAEQKLEAITTIERSIREQNDNGGNQQ